MIFKRNRRTVTKRTICVLTTRLEKRTKIKKRKKNTTKSKFLNSTDGNSLTFKEKEKIQRKALWEKEK